MIQRVYSARFQQSCFVYLVINEQNRSAMMIDSGILWDVHESPEAGLRRLEQELHEKDVTLNSIFITHSHFDHTASASLISNAFDIPVYIHPLEEHLLSTNKDLPKLNPMATLSFRWGFPDVERIASLETTEFSSLTQGTYSFEVIHVPGHTPGHRILYESRKKILFSGDFILPLEGYQMENETRDTTLTHGRVDLPGGQCRVLKESFLSVYPRIKDSSRIYSGHGTAYVNVPQHLAELAKRFQND